MEERTLIELPMISLDNTTRPAADTRVGAPGRKSVYDIVREQGSPVVCLFKLPMTSRPKAVARIATSARRASIASFATTGIAAVLWRIVALSGRLWS